MAKISGVGKGAFTVFINVREIVNFYMFITEEAIQTISLGVYQTYNAGNISRCQELINYNLNELIDPLIEFSDGPAGILAWPMGVAFAAFARSSRASMESYQDMISGD